jgi:hypothetical protein
MRHKHHINDVCNMLYNILVADDGSLVAQTCWLRACCRKLHISQISTQDSTLLSSYATVRD